MRRYAMTEPSCKKAAATAANRSISCLSSAVFIFAMACAVGSSRMKIRMIASRVGYVDKNAITRLSRAAPPKFLPKRQLLEILDGYQVDMSLCEGDLPGALSLIVGKMHHGAAAI